jgi:SAM-dependent methyltransferase
MREPIQDPYASEPAELLFVAKDNRGHGGTFPYYRARNGLIFIESIPDDLTLHYEHGFQPIPKDEAGLAEAARSEAFKIDLLRQFVAPGKYLEIGTWIGMAAYNARKAGFDVTTIEMNSECVDLMNRSGLNAIACQHPADWLERTDETFDAIAMWHSIEHLPEPWRVLDLAARRLNKGGVLLVAAPNPESAQARQHKEKWFHLDAPRHLYFLPMRMVEEIGERNGLRLLLKTTDDQLSLHLDRQGWEWPYLKRVLKVPVGGQFLNLIAAAAGALDARKYRKGDNDGAAYTLVMQRPAAS